MINKACVVDHAGEAILGFLLLMPDQDLAIVGSQNTRELIALLELGIYGGIDVKWFMKERFKMHTKLPWVPGL